jgi:hypothetical protein
MAYFAIDDILDYRLSRQVRSKISPYLGDQNRTYFENKGFQIKSGDNESIPSTFLCSFTDSGIPSTISIETENVKLDYLQPNNGYITDFSGGGGNNLPFLPSSNTYYEDEILTQEQQQEYDDLNENYGYVPEFELTEEEFQDFQIESRREEEELKRSREEIANKLARDERNNYAADVYSEVVTLLNFSNANAGRLSLGGLTELIEKFGNVLDKMYAVEDDTINGRKLHMEINKVEREISILEEYQTELIEKEEEDEKKDAEAEREEALIEAQRELESTQEQLKKDVKRFEELEIQFENLREERRGSGIHEEWLPEDKEKLLDIYNELRTLTGDSPMKNISDLSPKGISLQIRYTLRFRKPESEPEEKPTKMDVDPKEKKSPKEKPTKMDVDPKEKKVRKERKAPKEKPARMDVDLREKNSPKEKPTKMDIDPREKKSKKISKKETKKMEKNLLVGTSLPSDQTMTSIENETLQNITKKLEKRKTGVLRERQSIDIEMIEAEEANVVVPFIPTEASEQQQKSVAQAVIYSLSKSITEEKSDDPLIDSIKNTASVLASIKNSGQELFPNENYILDKIAQPFNSSMFQRYEEEDEKALDRMSDITNLTNIENMVSQYSLIKACNNIIHQDNSGLPIYRNISTLSEVTNNLANITDLQQGQSLLTKNSKRKRRQEKEEVVLQHEILLKLCDVSNIYKKMKDGGEIFSSNILNELRKSIENKEINEEMSTKLALLKQQRPKLSGLADVIPAYVGNEIYQLLNESESKNDLDMDKVKVLSNLRKFFKQEYGIESVSEVKNEINETIEALDKLKIVRSTFSNVIQYLTLPETLSSNHIETVVAPVKDFSCANMITLMRQLKTGDVTKEIEYTLQLETFMFNALNSPDLMNKPLYIDFTKKIHDSFNNLQLYKTPNGYTCFSDKYTTHAGWNTISAMLGESLPAHRFKNEKYIYNSRRSAQVVENNLSSLDDKLSPQQFIGFCKLLFNDNDGSKLHLQETFNNVSTMSMEEIQAEIENPKFGCLAYEIRNQLADVKYDYFRNFYKVFTMLAYKKLMAITQ